MFKRLGKKISMLLVCSTIIGFNSVPAFASTTASSSNKTSTVTATSNGKVFSTTIDSNGKLVTTSSDAKTAITALAATTSPYTLTDGGTCKQTITGQNFGFFYLTGVDPSMRNISVSCNVPVRTYIIAGTAGYSNWIAYDSGDSRAFNYITWHFLPGVSYSLQVVPDGTAPVEVTASMSQPTNSGFSYINLGDSYSQINSSITEKNMLSSGQLEQYGVAFSAASAGTYQITVQSVSKLTVTLAGQISDSKPVDNNSYTFTVKVSNTYGAQNNYVIMLYNTDVAGSGGQYSVKLQKISN